MPTKQGSLMQAIMLCFLTAATAHSGLAQSKNIDSLAKALDITTVDTVKVNIQNELSEIFHLKHDFKNAYKYANDALSLADKINFKRGKGLAYERIANSYLSVGDIKQCSEYSSKAFDVYKELGDKPSMARSLSFISLNTHNDPGKVLYYYLQILKFWEDAGDKKHVADSKNKIGSIYSGQGKLADALKYHLGALDNLTETQNEADLLSTVLSNIANDYIRIGNNDRKAGDETAATKKYREAIVFLSRMSELKQSNSSLTAHAYWNLGAVYVKIKSYELAEESFNKSMQISKAEGLKVQVFINENSLSDMYAEMGDYQKALEHYKEYTRYKDSVMKSDNGAGIRETTKGEMQYEFDKKQDSLKFQQQLTNEKLKQQQLLAVQQQQQLKLQQSSLALSNQQKELNHLAFLRTQSSCKW
jgi:tetratricopeptide (TPR) repeat protein